MSDNDDSDKTEEIAEKLDDGETLGGEQDDAEFLLTLDEEDDGDDE